MLRVRFIAYQYIGIKTGASNPSGTLNSTSVAEMMPSTVDARPSNFTTAEICSCEKPWVIKLASVEHMQRGNLRWPMSAKETRCKLLPFRRIRTEPFAVKHASIKAPGMKAITACLERNDAVDVRNTPNDHHRRVPRGSEFDQSWFAQNHKRQRERQSKQEGQ